MNDRSLEVRIPISPRADYFNRVRLIAHSVREFYPHAKIRVTVGADEEPRDLARELPWSDVLSIDWHWVDRGEFRTWAATEHPYIATMMERFRPPFGAQSVLMLDADVLVVRAFDELFAEPGGVKAMMAHASPFPEHRRTWEELFASYGLPEPNFNYELSGWGVMELQPERRYSPPYFNTGVVFAPAALLDRLYEPYIAALQHVRTRMDSYFFEQIAMTLSLAKTGIPAQILPIRYNYPNQMGFDAAHPSELAQIRLLHFLRTMIVSRERDFETPAAMRELVAREDLTGSNEVLRARVAHLLERFEE